MARLDRPQATTVPGPGARAPAGDIPTLNFEGDPVECRTCPHVAMAGSPQGCEIGYSCMQDAYARRIDRFFRAHPELANDHLDHPYFEVRAIAARHADVFQLPAMRNDVDETVRMQVVLRLPQRQLALMCGDPHREVRIRVAQRLDVGDLSRMLHDEDYEVRTVLARRLPAALLPLLANDADEQVRRNVAERLEMPALWRMASDLSERVRRIVAERLPQPLLERMADDEDFAVRWEVARRADPVQQRALLERLATDEDEAVAQMAQERLLEPGLDGLGDAETHFTAFQAED